LRAWLLVAALLLMACGAGTASTAGQTPRPPATAVDLTSIDSCTLVTAATASRLVGSTVAQVSKVATSATSSCIYASVQGSEGVAVFVQQTPGGDAKAVVRAALDHNATPAARLTTAVGGIGDAAGTKTDANDAAVVFAKGTLLVVLTATAAGKSGAVLLPKLEALAKQLAAKL
jgi:hypothetical protein